MRYEHRHQKPISRAQFVIRLLRSIGLAVALIGIALVLGVWGYHFFGGLPWIDAFLNASMILGGMGPVDPMTTETGKIFAGCYALFSGLAFIGLAGLLFMPIAHRLLHHFHYEDEER